MKQTLQKSPLTYLVLLLGLGVVGLGFWFLPSSSEEHLVQNEPSEKIQKTVIDEPVSDKNESIETVVQTPVVAKAELLPEDNPFFEAETKARLIQIADSYAEDLQYPVFSKPIRNRDELQKYLPNTTAANSLPLDSKNENSPRIALKTSKLQYFDGEAILAQAFVEGQLDAQSVTVDARLVMHGQTLIQNEALPAANKPKRFQISIDSRELPAQLESTDLRLVAVFDIDGVRYEIGAPIKYVQASAAIEYVGSSEVLDSVLQIPVFVNTSAPGFHQLSAILYNAETGQPLVHLNAEKELLVERDFIPLQAHIVALKAGGHEGPYLLKNFSLIRMPSEPDFTTTYGRVPAEGVEVNGYSFSNYRDEPYVDEEAQERLDFLKKLGGQI